MTERTRLTDNFYLDEFICKCRNCTFPSDEWMDPTFMLRLQHLRDEINIPLFINSGARCRDYNHATMGAKDSGHIVDVHKPAKAADISTSNMSAEQKYLLIKLAIRYQFRGIGIAETFIHIDTKNRKAVWIYK